MTDRVSNETSADVGTEMDEDRPPPWDREGDLSEAEAQVRSRVQSYHTGSVVWINATSVRAQLDAIQQTDERPVVGSTMMLWTWSATNLARLSDVVRERQGVVVFLEPTAGLGLRLLAQRAGRRWFQRRIGHHFGRDIPAELRAAGFIVTTQVRLRDGVVGDYVRGEAQHFTPNQESKRT